MKWDFRSLVMIGILVINVLIIGPGSWFLNLYWTETIKNRERTEQELTDLQKNLYELKHDISTLYLTKDDFQEYQKERGERYRHLDNKLRNR